MRRGTRTCQINTADPREDIGFRVAYHACGKPAAWTTDTDGRETVYMCQAHTDEFLLGADPDVTVDPVADTVRAS